MKTLSQQLAEIVNEHHLLKHPFYQAWTAGTLDRDVLKQYAGQYYEQVSRFPRFLSAIHANCPDISVRKVLLENLVDEELSGTDHPTLWMQFAEGMGATRAEVESQTPLPETAAMVETFDGLARTSWQDGLCALYAYESQVPEVSTSKIDGLKQHYGIDDERTLAFFTAHQKYDVEHTEKVAALIDEHGNKKTAPEATERAAKSLWSFLDGIGREAGVC